MTALVTAVIAVLTVFALRLLLRAPATPCACLGSTNAVVTRTHVAIDVAAVCTAIAAASGGPPLAPLAGRWVAGAVFVVLVACGVKLAVLAPETGTDACANMAFLVNRDWSRFLSISRLKKPLACRVLASPHGMLLWPQGD